MGKKKCIKDFIPRDARLIIPSSFEDCLTYGEQVRFLYKKIKELETRVAELEAIIDENTGS